MLFFYVVLDDVCLKNIIKYKGYLSKIFFKFLKVFIISIWDHFVNFFKFLLLLNLRFAVYERDNGTFKSILYLIVQQDASMILPCINL